MPSLSPLSPLDDNIISAQRPGLKTGVENYIACSEIGSGFEEPGGTSPPRISRSTPPPGGGGVNRLHYNAIN